MKYHALFVIFEKKWQIFKIVVCCKLKMALKGLIGNARKQRKQAVTSSLSLEFDPYTAYYTTDSVSVNIRLFLD